MFIAQFPTVGILIIDNGSANRRPKSIKKNSPPTTMMQSSLSVKFYAHDMSVVHAELLYEKHGCSVYFLVAIIYMQLLALTSRMKF